MAKARGALAAWRGSGLTGATGANENGFFTSAATIFGAGACDCFCTSIPVATTDTRIFHPAGVEQPRSGTCFYASKYQDVHGGQLLEVTRGSVEITRGPGGHVQQGQSFKLGVIRLTERFVDPGLPGAGGVARRDP